MTRKRVGKHTSPETAGSQNLSEDYIRRNKDKKNDGLMDDILVVYKRGSWARKEYDGLWTDEALEEQIDAYFEFCAERSLKPAKAGLRLWLGISKSQYWEWETKPEKYGYKSNLLAQAGAFMELQYVGRGEQYPTMNIFLLKSGHGYVDKSEVEVTTNTGNKEDVVDMVAKLGLDKPK